MGLRVGIVRDERYLDHKPGHTHPDHPNRLKAIYKMLDMDFANGLINIDPEPATLEHLELVHTPAYIQTVLKTADQDYTNLAPDTPASANTYLTAWLAVGGCLKGLEALMSGQCDVCFSLVRPPGHHALPSRAGGFCIFNNVGITVRHAIRRYELRRVLIIDWDIHHGNGLNNLFYEEKEALYMSSHDMLLYPFTGDWEETGKGEGKGYTINLPIPRELEDEDIIHVYREILNPVVRRYCPELILVAAGFDGHHKDPIGKSRLTEQAFERLTYLLLHLRGEGNQPPILFVLEGGYNPRALAGCVREVLKALTAEDHHEKSPVAKTGLAAAIVEKACRIHTAYRVWAD